MTQTFNVGARSLFVTATAWLFILLGGLASLSALLQRASVSSFMPAVAASGGRTPLPLLTGLLLGYLPYVVGAGLLFSLATLASAVGLLMRLEWARRVFIGLLSVAIVANLGDATLFPPRRDLVSLLDTPLPLVRPLAAVHAPRHVTASSAA